MNSSQALIKSILLRPESSRFILLSPRRTISVFVKRTDSHFNCFQNSERRNTLVWRCFHSTPPVSAIVPFKLTDVGEGIKEVEVLNWSVKVGDEIQEFDPVCDVQSDKASLTISSRYKGKVTRLHYDVGQMAQVGTPLCDIDTDTKAPNSQQTKEPEPTGNTESVQSQQVQHSYSGGSVLLPTKSNPVTLSKTGLTSSEETSGGNSVKKTRKLSSAELKSLMTPSETNEVEPKLPNRVLAAPTVRLFAKENKVDLFDVLPFATGPNGRILKQDVEKYLNSNSNLLNEHKITENESKNESESEETSESEGNDKIIELKGIRKQMFLSMTKSLEIPHFIYSDEVIFDNLHSSKETLNSTLMSSNSNSELSKVTYLSFIIKAVSLALKTFPELNSHFDSKTQKLTVKSSHNISFAVDTKFGLLVPNIKNVQNKNILSISSEVSVLAKKS